MASALHGLQDVENKLMKQDAEIDKLNIREAIKKLKEHNIDFKDLSDIRELRLRLKQKLLCKTTRKEVGGVLLIHIFI